MEEAVIGVYKTKVLCHYDDGRRTLLTFTRSLRPPVSEKFKGMADLVSAEYRYLVAKEQKKAIKAELKRRCNAMKDKKRSKKSSKLISLKKDYKPVKGACYTHRISWKIKWSDPGKKRSKESSKLISLKKDYKTMKDACQVFYKYAHQINWKIKWSNPDEWLIPNNKILGLQIRSAEHSCGGYDYRNPLKAFEHHV